MIIVKENIASINNNNPELDRVELSIALDEDGTYFIISDTDEDCGPHFNTINECESAIYDMWGKSPEWDLQYN